MPWKNRYIGNPVLTGILNLFFRSGVGDAHCGLRAIRRQSYTALRLRGSGMEFASEMVIKASKSKAWAEALEKNSWTPALLTGKAFDDFVDDEFARLRGIMHLSGMV